MLEDTIQGVEHMSDERMLGIIKRKLTKLTNRPVTILHHRHWYDCDNELQVLAECTEEGTDFPQTIFGSFVFRFDQLVVDMVVMMTRQGWMQLCSGSGQEQADLKPLALFTPKQDED